MPSITPMMTTIVREKSQFWCMGINACETATTPETARRGRQRGQRHANPTR
ncbi:hypothetical protein [Massilia violaceinigra]|uniref:hypothetical protein n=1 Tax=Massilia violaceinigra TaxID=2045208 RepID=UPI0012FE556F|nr:hypothetical protein [Massilia violaceinigra]